MSLEKAGFLSSFLEILNRERFQRVTAGAAPVGPEIHHHHTGGLQHLGFKSIGAQILYHLLFLLWQKCAWPGLAERTQFVYN